MPQCLAWERVDLRCVAVMRGSRQLIPAHRVLHHASGRRQGANRMPLTRTGVGPKTPRYSRTLRGGNVTRETQRETDC